MNVSFYLPETLDLWTIEIFFFVIKKLLRFAFFLYICSGLGVVFSLSARNAGVCAYLEHYLRKNVNIKTRMIKNRANLRFVSVRSWMVWDLGPLILKCQTDYFLREVQAERVLGGWISRKT